MSSSPVKVTHGEREILAHRVTLEPIVGEDAPQIGVPAKVDAVHVPHFALVPVRSVVDTDGRGNRGDLVGIGLDPNPRLMCHGQQVVHDLMSSALPLAPRCRTHLEAHGPRGEVYRGDIHDLLVLALGVVSEKGEDGDDCLGRDADRELVLVD